MPGTFLQNMDDGDDSGSIDIVDSVPDALATTARYFKGLGWTAGLPWGIEVSVPREQALAWNALERDHACLEAEMPAGLCRGLDQWAASGFRRIDGGALLLDLVPAGVVGHGGLLHGYRFAHAVAALRARAISLRSLLRCLRNVVSRMIRPSLVNR